MENASKNRPVAEQIRSTRSVVGAWDEIRKNGENLYPAWDRYFQALGGMTVGELTQRWDEAKRILRDNGVSYNVYADPRGADRPWQLDAIPQVMDESEWQFLSEGIAQRARLLDVLLADIYGEQRTITEGILPAGLVFANPGYLRPMHGVRPRRDQWLHLYACELARDAHGQWVVLVDRTQAPAGAGYVLENRIVISRAFPEAYRAARVRRLAPYFLRMRRTLQALGGRDNPHIVLLTPGPFSETYFEHAYLSRYLGFTLAEGGDLAVRDEKVFLKTLGGLQPVDVILRRMDDDFCDPLELRGDSNLGIPGLVQAVRAGNVAVANSLGTGVAESTALMGYMPDLCRYLLNEELILPSVDSWWCGENFARDHVVANLGSLVAKPAFPSLRAEPVFGDRLGEQGRQIMSERIERDPEAWSAQGLVPMSGTVEWNGTHFRPRSMGLRMFACRSGDGFDVLPGGLVRISNEPGRANIAIQAGGGSKDLWVMTPNPVEEVSLLQSGKKSEVFRRSGIELPSRVADNLFWLGRYAERAEGIARLSRATLGRLSGESAPGESGELGVLISAMREIGMLGPNPPSGRYGVEGAEHEVIASVFLSDKGMGLQQTLSALHQAGFQVRDRISNDTWRILHHLGRDFAPGRRQGSSTVGDVLSLLDTLLLHLSALAGNSKENTTRGFGWRFLDLGRRLERSQFTVDMLSIVQDASNDGHLGLDALLEVFDNSITYRSRYLTDLQFAQAVDLILNDDGNPRSLLFQLQAISRHLDALPRLQENPFPRREQALILSAITELRLLDFPGLARDPEGAERTRLGDLLKRLHGDLPSVSDCLSRAWLSHAETTRQLSRGNS
jgi:uncharacterized circularly permuted ATP-grasp superfamily protein/uncharacterized alpha-E superfamily protein